MVKKRTRSLRTRVLPLIESRDPARAESMKLIAAYLAEDIEEVKESWKIIIQQGAKMIYPGHGVPFSVDVIKNILKIK